MTQMEAKRSNGVVWFILGGACLLVALLQLLTVAAATDAATMGGKIAGLVIFGLAGAALIVLGVRRRR